MLASVVNNKQASASASSVVVIVGKAVAPLPLGRAVYLLARTDSMAYWQKSPNIQKTMMHTDAMYVMLCI